MDDCPVRADRVAVGDRGHDAGMSESRQQRRSRERAEAKTARRPGPASTTETARPSRVLEVALDRIVVDDAADPDPVSWSAAWGLREDSVGHEDSSENLPELIEAILDDARTSWGQRYELRIEWIVGGDAPEGQTVDDAVAATGSTLPSTLSRPSPA